MLCVMFTEGMSCYVSYSLRVCHVRFFSHLNRSRLEHLVAEHLDHMHYLNDILSLDITSLNDVLVSHILRRLLLPLYVYSLTIGQSSCKVSHTPYSLLYIVILQDDKKPYISSTVALFLLSQVIPFPCHY